MNLYESRWERHQRLAFVTLVIFVLKQNWIFSIHERLSIQNFIRKKPSIFYRHFYDVFNENSKNRSRKISSYRYSTLRNFIKSCHPPCHEQFSLTRMFGFRATNKISANGGGESSKARLWTKRIISPRFEFRQIILCLFVRWKQIFGI